MKAEAKVATEQEIQTALEAMSEVLQSIESGDLTARVALSLPENDPVGALSACINRMTALLAERREETLSYQRELEGQIETIEKQRVAIRELSTPIIEVWSGVLCAPIVGVLDSARASELTSALLHNVVQTKASLAIIDVTGIEAMDTQATDHFLRMARAIRLLGSECALSGVHPNVARTIVHMGIDLDGIDSYRTLRDALHRYVSGKVSARRRTRA
ncbi:MAG TPA: STAS domain-containing protein [Polyangiales bacterium]|nr:STAS domain-containing protein [Polyangiales bacterium]